MEVKTSKEYLEEVKKANRSVLDNTKSTINKNYDTQTATVNKNYSEKINNTEDDYQNLYDQNAVQKLVNERQVAENMANLGLTDSGLNRTQQTAVQLSYANNKAKFDLSKQKQLDSLASELADKISEIEMSRSSDLLTAENNWNSEMQSYATSMHNNALKQYAEVEKAQIEAETARIEAQDKIIENQQKEDSYIIKANGGALSFEYQGTLKDHGVSVKYNDDGTTTYYDKNSKKQTTMASTVNPYTRDDNSAVIKKWGAFDNGYQYKGVIGVGPFVKTKNGYVESVDKITLNKDGQNQRTQNIFKTNEGGITRYWTWDGGINDYAEVHCPAGEWIVKKVGGSNGRK